MSLCTAGSNAEARIQRAARSVRLRAPTPAVDTLDADHGLHDQVSIEIVLAETDHAPAEV